MCIVSGDYQSFFEHYKKQLIFDNKDDLVKNTCKLICIIKCTSKLNIELMRTEVNNLVDLYFTHNMVPFSIALYKLLGIDMSSDHEMIKMQLHAQD